MGPDAQVFWGRAILVLLPFYPQRVPSVGRSPASQFAVSQIRWLDLAFGTPGCARLFRLLNMV
jgi:hypothetical protein